MLLKHPAVELTWRVPEPIKAGGETLRGVLIISAKELSESELKASVSKKSKKKMSDDRNLWIEHIEIDLTGEEGSHQSLNIEDYGASVMTDSHMLSAEDQYRQQHSQGSSSRISRHNLHRESVDGLDEVGFGAHIDKPVAAAGDQVTLDMFVVKSDLMKVVDIKVSLVETIQIFSLLDHDDASTLVSPIASRARVFEVKGEGVESEIPERGSAEASKPRRRLVDTHVVKIAKDYVPAQSEESHANDYHLKGYYEDHEYFRTAKSLSMYKLNMRIPENALTILDRELLRADYMFVIKFFFKGRMGAFLEVPIEIVSQYNHNRISTISGAISCVSNTVQIALPPVPILSKRSEDYRSDVGSDVASNNQPSLSESGVANGIDVSGDLNQGGDNGAAAEHSKSIDERSLDSTGYRRSAEATSSEHEEITISEDDAQLQATRRSSSSDPESPTHGTASKDIRKAKSIAAQQSALNKTEITEQAKAAKAAIEEREKEKERILASSRLSRKESVEGKSNVARLTAALMNNMESDAASPTKELTRTKSNGSSAGSSLRSRAMAFEGEGVPKIVTDGVSRRSSRASTSSGNSLSQCSPHYKDSPSSLTPTSATQSTISSMGKASIASPALPLLFDLTSAALPSPLSSAPATVVITSKPPSSTSSCSSASSSDCSSEGTTVTTILTCPSIVSVSKGSNRLKDFDPQHSSSQLRQNSSTVGSSGNRTTSSRDDDSSSHHNGFVAKIAKSLSASLLLRSRAMSGSGGASSPNGSAANLAMAVSQQSSAFTLAATTLSALTLLPSVGQSAAGNTNGAHHHHHHLRHQVMRRSSRQFHASSQPLKSCLKKRRQSAPINMTSSISAAITSNTLQAPSPFQHQHQQQQQQGQNKKKKVTFAKGTTPQPSPTTSQIFVQDAEQNMAGRMYQQYPPGHPLSNVTTFASQHTTRSIAGNAATVQGLQHHHNITAVTGMNHHNSIGAAGTTSAAVAAGAVMRSPNSASPRSRLHHPFDGHPSRLSPLEKQRLDFRIKSLSPLHSSSNNGVHAAQPQQQQRGGVVAQSNSGDMRVDREEEEEECDYEEEEDEYDDEDDEDDDDDEGESEEERIERRRQARVAWLAKYGDAFKQVYGAVPELPPI
ncbi:hypothetical protein BGX26_003683 [Mortierella sp. AD094]|nr:hypothetical protein BGX26_003683 [Mortierella sp. AD094]